MKRVPGRGPAALSSPSRSQGPADTAQVVSSPGEFPAAARALERVRAEYVVRVAGTLRLRKDPNPQLPTGAVELLAEEARRPAQRMRPALRLHACMAAAERGGAGRPQRVRRAGASLHGTSCMRRMPGRCLRASTAAARSPQHASAGAASGRLCLQASA